MDLISHDSCARVQAAIIALVAPARVHTCRSPSIHRIVGHSAIAHDFTIAAEDPRGRKTAAAAWIETPLPAPPWLRSAQRRRSRSHDRDERACAREPAIDVEFAERRRQHQDRHRPARHHISFNPSCTCRASYVEVMIAR
jgi:hypothetical protein